MSVAGVQYSEEGMLSGLGCWEGRSSRGKATGKGAELEHRLLVPGPGRKPFDDGAVKSGSGSKPPAEPGGPWLWLLLQTSVGSQ